jgi:hypothetical protein
MSAILTLTPSSLFLSQHARTLQLCLKKKKEKKRKEKRKGDTGRERKVSFFSVK